MSTTETQNGSAREVSPKSSWLKSGLHTITLHSGATIKIRYPNLALMMRTGLIPTHLRAIATKVAKGEVTPTGQTMIGDGEPTDDAAFDEVVSVVQLMDEIIKHMVVEPELNQEDIDLMPPEDRDLLLAIANRERDVDAVGRRLGVEPLDRWEKFRREHHCSEDCRSCQKVRQLYSSLDLSDLSLLRG